MFKKNSNEITIKKIIIWGFSGVLLISIFTTFIILLPSPFKKFMYNNDWISFYGSLFGGIIGAVVALLIVNIESNKRKRDRENRNELFHNYFINNHLKLINTMAVLLDDSLKKQIEISNKGDLGMPSYPYICFPAMESREKLLELVDQDLLTYEEVSIYNRLYTHISFLEQQKDNNFLDKNMYHNALINLNMKLSNSDELFEKFKEKETPITKFLSSILCDWKHQLEDGRYIVKEIRKDINSILNKRKNSV